MGSPRGRLRKNKVFPSGQISPSVASHQWYERFNKISLAYDRTAEEKITSLHSAVPKTWVCI